MLQTLSFTQSSQKNNMNPARQGRSISPLRLEDVEADAHAAALWIPQGLHAILDDPELAALMDAAIQAADTMRRNNEVRLNLEERLDEMAINDENQPPRLISNNSEPTRIIYQENDRPDFPINALGGPSLTDFGYLHHIAMFRFWNTYTTRTFGTQPFLTREQKSLLTKIVIKPFTLSNSFLRAVYHSARILFNLYLPDTIDYVQPINGIRVDYVLQSSGAPIRILTLDHSNITYNNGRMYITFCVPPEEISFLQDNGGFYLAFMQNESVTSTDRVTHVTGHWLRFYPQHSMTYYQAIFDNTRYDPTVLQQPETEDLMWMGLSEGRARVPSERELERQRRRRAAGIHRTRRMLARRSNP